MERTDITDNVNTILAVAEVPLSGPIYGDIDGTLSLEIRDFATTERTLVVQWNLEGKTYTTVVSLSRFEEAFDGMRAELMAPDWDDAMIQLTERGN